MRISPPHRPWLGGRSAVSFALLLLVLSACGGGDRVARPLPPGLELPVVGTLGRLPTGPAVIHVDVDEDGRIHCGGKGPLSLVGLRDAFVAETAEVAWREYDGSSRKILLLTADARLPWVVPIWILQTASGPRVQLWRIFLAARAREDGRQGAIGLTLPRDRSGPVPDVPNPPFSLRARIRLRAGPADGPEVVAAPVAAAFASHPKHWVVVEIAAVPPTGPAVPTGFVTEVLDVALRSGARRIGLEGLPLPTDPERDERGPDDPPAFDPDDLDGFLRCVAWWKARFGEPTLTVTGTVDDPPLDPPPLPAARGVLGGLYGAEVPAVEPGPRDVADPSPADEPFRRSPWEDAQVEPMPDVWFFATEYPRPRRDVTELVEDPDPLLDALAWLAARQRRDGGWVEEGGGDQDVGVTGLALSAFLGAGYTNRGRHDFAKVVARGLRSLKNRQDADGCFGPRDHHGFLRDHAFATFAMIEALRQTGSPIFRASAQKALDFTLATYDSGWSDGDDATTTAWMALGLWSAAQIVAADRERDRTPRLAIDEDVLCAAVRSVTGAAGTALHHFMEMESAATETLPPRPDPLDDPMATLWMTLAAFERSGDTWTTWSEALETKLLSAQRSDGDAAGARGSWNAAGAEGRVATTALFALCLGTYYRYSHAIGWR